MLIKHNIDITSSYIVENAIDYHLKLLKHHNRHLLYNIPTYKESMKLINQVRKSAKSHKSISLSHKDIRAIIYCILELSANPLLSKPKYKYFNAKLGNLYNRLLNIFTATMSHSHKVFAKRYFHVHGMTPQSWVNVLKL